MTQIPTNAIGHEHQELKIQFGAEVSDLENTIDEMVYRLYELTEEEIKIVEGR